MNIRTVKSLLNSVKPGCIVVLFDLKTCEVLKYKYLASHDVTTYKTMGYKTKKYAIVSSESEADGSFSISDESPLGKAIANKRLRDVVSYELNGKTFNYKILSIYTLHDEV